MGSRDSDLTHDQFVARDKRRRLFGRIGEGVFVAIGALLAAGLVVDLTDDGNPFNASFLLDNK